VADGLTVLTQNLAPSLPLYLYFSFFRKRSSVASERQEAFECNQLLLTESFRFIVSVRQQLNALLVWRRKSKGYAKHCGQPSGKRAGFEFNSNHEL